MIGRANRRRRPTRASPEASVTDEHHDDEPLRRPRGRRAAPPKRSPWAAAFAPLLAVATSFWARIAALPARVPGIGRGMTRLRDLLAPAALWVRGHRQASVITGAGLVAVAMLGGAVALIGSTAGGQVDEAAPSVQSPRPTPSTPPTSRAYPPILPTATPPAAPSPSIVPDDPTVEPTDDPGVEPSAEPSAEPDPTVEPTQPPVDEGDHPGRGKGPKKPRG
ncbi:hypothetical protein MUN74_06135 [Agromyces endophyticus]|uniref:hypothetical protein n=1 Tax=Agromyces sp. H17E-10 TaxID=2932244 RepID=UPI001FD4EB46|nr:hypothetical protein [Agromyces sp. H17E-10]UOQ90491.1 hypothetical protein MUN74_06135 [Agromyces sp. H17E-10]